MGSAYGQGVLIRSCLPEPVEMRVRQWIAEKLPEADVAIHRDRTEELFAELRGSERVEFDLVLGLDGVYAFELARLGKLAIYPSRAAKGLRKRYIGPDARFVVPWLSPLVIAVNGSVWPSDSRPAEFEDLLFDPSFRDSDHLVLCVPEAQPALWVGWMQDQIRQGYGEERALAWLRTLDARVSAYENSVDAVLSSLVSGRGSISVLAAVDAKSIGFELVVPSFGVPAQGHAVGIVAGRDTPEVCAVFDALVSPELVYEVAQAHLVPATRNDVDLARLPDEMRDSWMPFMLPYDHEHADAEGWFAEWHNSVRGQGDDWEWLDFAFEGVFAMAFVVFLFFVYRNLQASEGK